MNLTINPDTLIATTQSLNLRSAGHTGVEIHWNYAQVYLSASTVRTIDLGVYVGSIWISDGIASFVVGALGGAIESVTNGIWFDYNYLDGVLTNNYGWQ